MKPLVSQVPIIGAVTVFFLNRPVPTYFPIIALLSVFARFLIEMWQFTFVNNSDKNQTDL